MLSTTPQNTFGELLSGRDELVGRISRKLRVGQARTPNDDLVGTDGRWILESCRPTGGQIVILIGAVAAHAQTTGEYPVLVEGSLPGKKTMPFWLRLGG